LNSPIPPPLPDFYIVEDGLHYTKKGEKKHFTVQNRYGQFKMVIFYLREKQLFNLKFLGAYQRCYCTISMQSTCYEYAVS
jgi:hypothetical protein